MRNLNFNFTYELKMTSSLRFLVVFFCILFHITLPAEELQNDDDLAHSYEEIDDDVMSFEECFPIKKQPFADHDPFTSSLASTEGLVSTVVGNMVSVITGDLVVSENDVTLLGPETLTLTRSHFLKMIRNDLLEESWEFNHPGELSMSQHKKQHKHQSISALVKQNNGSRLLFKDKVLIGKGHHHFELPLSWEKKGITNCCCQERSGRTNVRNMKLHFERDGNRCECHVTSLGGGIRVFDATDTLRLDDHGRHLLPATYKQKSEMKPNGNFILYKDQKVIAANPSKKQLYSWLKFQRHSLQHLEVTTSTGKSIHYGFTYLLTREDNQERDRKRFFLTSVNSPEKPVEQYSYHIINKGHSDAIAMLKRIVRPEGRFMKVAYYLPGLNGLYNDNKGNLQDAVEDFIDQRDDSESFNILKGDARAYRVKFLAGPVGVDKTPIITHRFLYRVHSSGSGTTNVYDAYDRKTAYKYDREHRLQEIVKCLEDGKPYSSERYVWDLDDPTLESKVRHAGDEEEVFRPNETYLLGKYLSDGQGHIHSGRFFTHDKRGNIREQAFYGYLTGRNSPRLVLHRTHLPAENGTECYRHSYVYSKDKWNLLKEESEDNGKRITYQHYPNSDLIATKMLYDRGNIVLRQFFEYDANTTLIKKFEDDGVSPDIGDSSGFTERLITTYFPRSVAPVGLPERVDQTYIDNVTWQERLLGRVCSDYSVEGRLLKQDHFDANGDHRYRLEWAYDDHGNVILEVDALGRKINRQYDLNDNLIVEQGPSTEFYTRHTYDLANRLVHSDEIHNDGRHFTISHRYDYNGNRIASVDRFGNETRYEYDALNRLVATIYPPVQDEYGQQQIAATRIEYDPFNNAIGQIDARGLRTSYAYNAYGKPTIIAHPDGRYECIEYNTDGTVANEVAPTGLKTIYTRDSLGQITQKAFYSGELLTADYYQYKGKKLICHTDAEGQDTHFYYDGAGRPSGKVCGEYRQTLEYDALGRVCKSTEWYGGDAEVSIQRTEYDLLDRVIEERTENAQGLILKKVNYTYDDYGNRTHVILETSKGRSISYTEYNSDKQPTRIVDAEGHETRILYDYGFINAIGQRVLQTHTTDPQGKVSIATYDACNRVVNITDKNAFGVVLTTKQIFYDANGNKLKTKDAVIVDGVVDSEVVTEWQYNAVNQLVIIIEGLGSPEQKLTQIVYNQFGEKVLTLKPNGIGLQYAYDALGRLATCCGTDGSFSYLYQYNRTNQMTTVTDIKNGTSSFRTHDAMGRMTSETLGNGLKMTYGYDRLSRPTHVQLPDGSGVEYVYDAAFLKEVHRIKDQNRVYSHIYQERDLSGAVLKTHQVNQIKSTTYTYDLLRRPKGLDAPGWKQSDISYDNAGNLIHFEIEDRKGHLNYQFAYDDYDQVKEESGASPHIYKCNSLSNRLKKDESSYSYNSLNELLKQGETTYQYDRNGNLISKVNDSQETAYEYDALDRLVAVVEGDNRISYTYDAFNRRLVKTKEGVTTRYLYQGPNEIGSVDHTGQIKELRLLGLSRSSEAGAAIAIELGTKTFTPVHDQGGNIACLLDSAGIAVETYRYSAFGEEEIIDADGNVTRESVVGNPWRYSSKRVDSETGWVYFGMRYYAPDIGRWTTTDPAGYDDGPNLYSYLHHRPLLYTDAYGLQGESYIAGQMNASASSARPQNNDNWSYSPMPSFQFATVNPMQVGQPSFDSRGGANVGSPFSNSGFVSNLGRPAPPNGGCIGFENGVGCADYHAYSNAEYLSSLGGGVNVHYTYNPSNAYMPFLKALGPLGLGIGVVLDLFRCYNELINYACYPSVKRLHAQWDAFFAGAHPEQRYLHFCHSEGCIITRNALMTYDRELRERIIVVAIAPAAYIDNYLCSEVHHYCSERDIVPYLDFRGRVRCRDTTTILKPHKNAPKVDHGFQSETYQPYLEMHINDHAIENTRFK